jgi:hypothetical protein
MKRSARAAATLALLSMVPLASVYPGELDGSRASLRKQHRVARKNDFTFLRTASQVREFVRERRLVRIRPTANYGLGRVSFPVARPQVKLFLDRLGAQYRQATGDRLVITSLTRPISRQPRNASALSVHPAGMAVDLRVPRSVKGRRWLERVLLELEDESVLDVTREHHPPHYHVAVFPREYEKYVARLTGERASAD